MSEVDAAAGGPGTPDAVRADRHRLVSRVAGDIGHELKNPIHASVINLELVRKRIADGERDDALARREVVSAQVRRVHGVVEGLLKLLRDGKQPGGAQELDRLVEVVLPLLSAQANSAAVPFEWTPAGPGALCTPGADGIGHTLVGLVAVAVAMSRGRTTGTVRVEGLSAPVGIRVSALGEGPGDPPERVVDPALIALVRRLAGSAGLVIREEAVGDGVSWSSTVLLDGASNA